MQRSGSHTMQNLKVFYVTVYPAIWRRFELEWNRREVWRENMCPVQKFYQRTSAASKAFKYFRDTIKASSYIFHLQLRSNSQLQSNFDQSNIISNSVPSVVAWCMMRYHQRKWSLYVFRYCRNFAQATVYRHFVNSYLDFRRLTIKPTVWLNPSIQCLEFGDFLTWWHSTFLNWTHHLSFRSHRLTFSPFKINCTFSFLLYPKSFETANLIQESRLNILI